MTTCHDVADYFLSLQDDESGDTISNLKLQKLAYYAQGFSLAIFKSPLFEEPIEAWIHGPVVPDLYHRFSEHRSASIPMTEDFDPDTIDKDARELLDEVYEVYGQYSGWKLRNMTHEELPWKNAPVQSEITHESMGEYFTTLIN